MARVSDRLRSAYRLGVQGLWILLLVSIPVTSFSWLRKAMPQRVSICAKPVSICLPR